MNRRHLLLGVSAMALSACSTMRAPRQLGADGRPLPSVYDIGDPAAVQFRILDSANAVRGASGAPALRFSAELNAAAATHSRDMAVQNRPWHFGSDGSSPIDRARRAGYTGTVLGENISETYETEIETFTAWMEQPDTRDVITDPAARDLGFAWYQEPTGKIWWTLLTGDGGSAGPANAPRG
ncbi:CAP domain-containing protein [Rhodobacterales bacterium HKCCE2091]|nr:CAP domain-containing protein [Rhodobacterales bacterium HKCCE2091]